MAQMPAGALIFLRHDVETARKTIARTYSAQQINESTRGVETSHFSAEISNDFCAITLSSMDGKPISRSGLLLLTTGRVENTGQAWNEGPTPRFGARRQRGLKPLGAISSSRILRVQSAWM